MYVTASTQTYTREQSDIAVIATIWSNERSVHAQVKTVETPQILGARTSY